MRIYENNQQEMSYITLGNGNTAFIWAHGWAQNHSFMLELAKSLEFMGTHFLVDFPGFGESPKPKDDWDISGYASFMSDFIASLDFQKVVWVGHSFGSRIGLRLAASAPDQIGKLILLASPGLPRKRSLFNKILFWARIWLYKTLKFLLPFESTRAKLRGMFGSADYKNAGHMYKIFINVIKENLNDAARQVKVPTLLIYGENDNETPPDIGMRLSQLIPNASLKILADHNHYSILTSGKHQVSQLIKKFVEQKQND